MRTKTKILAISALAVVGLLLGGNKSAADTTGGQTQTAAVADTAAQVQLIQQQIQNLTAQVRQLQGQAPAAPVAVTPQLTQAQLNAIQTQVSAIRAQVQRIALQVQVLVTIRQIQLKTAQLQTQVQMMTGAAPMIPATTSAPAGNQAAASTVTNPTDRQQLEARAEQIRQQIEELQQELAARQAAEQTTPATGATQAPATPAPSGGEVSAPDNQAAGTPITVAAKPETKSFWQMILDFFKNLFTF